MFLGEVDSIDVWEQEERRNTQAYIPPKQCVLITLFTDTGDVTLLYLDSPMKSRFTCVWPPMPHDTLFLHTCMHSFVRTMHTHIHTLETLKHLPSTAC